MGRRDSDSAAIGGVVDRLERKTWVIRSINPDDKRARHVTLTAQGRAVLQKAAPIVSALQSDILSGLSDAERAQFISLASKAVGLEDGFDPLR